MRVHEKNRWCRCLADMGHHREMSDFEGLKVGHADRWVLEKQLGRGSYGQVWLANDSMTNEKVAVKFESLRTPRPVLYLEYMFYKRIVRETQTERIPKILTLCPFVDSDGSEWTCLVMECMGKSLETLINKHKKFSLKTTIQLAIEMLTIIEGLSFFSPFHVLALDSCFFYPIHLFLWSSCAQVRHHPPRHQTG